MLYGLLRAAICFKACSGLPYALRLAQGCHFKASGWSISSIARLNSRVMVELTVTAVPHMSLLQIIPHETIKRRLKSPVWKSMGEIKNIQLDMLAISSVDDTLI